MNTEILITSTDGVLQIKQKQNSLMFIEVPITDVIGTKVQEILTYIESLKTIEDKMDIALNFIQTNATVEQKLTLLDVYPKWEPLIPYEVGKELQYNGKLYQVIQAHTSQTTWTPDISFALFKTVQLPGVIGTWVQPTGAHDAYPIDTKVLLNGVTYKSLINSNVYSPIDYPAGWRELYAINREVVFNGKTYKSLINLNDTTPTTNPENWQELITAIPNFVQPTGAHDAYALGAKVTFGGKVYESLIPANTYSPSAYPAGWKLLP